MSQINFYLNEYMPPSIFMTREISWEFSSKKGVLKQLESLIKYSFILPLSFVTAAIDDSYFDITTETVFLRILKNIWKQNDFDMVFLMYKIWLRSNGIYSVV